MNSLKVITNKYWVIFFLSAGETVTNQIREVQMRIKEKYPNGIIRFEEMRLKYFFLSHHKKIFEKLKIIFNKPWALPGQKARVIIDNTLFEKDDAEFAFSQLDRMWKINKMVEEVLEQKYKKKISSEWFQIAPTSKWIIFRKILSLENDSH